MSSAHEQAASEDNTFGWTTETPGETKFFSNLKRNEPWPKSSHFCRGTDWKYPAYIYRFRGQSKEYLIIDESVLGAMTRSTHSVKDDGKWNVSFSPEGNRATFSCTADGGFTDLDGKVVSQLIFERDGLPNQNPNCIPRYHPDQIQVDAAEVGYLYRVPLEPESETKTKSLYDFEGEPIGRAARAHGVGSVPGDDREGEGRIDSTSKSGTHPSQEAGLA